MSKYNFKRPKGAPDVWRREDFIYTRHARDPCGFSEIVKTEECDKTQFIYLCTTLDSLLGHEQCCGTIDKQYYRCRVLALFRNDLLHAAEIIDAYNLSE